MKKDKKWLIKELLDDEVDGYDNYYNGGYEDGLAYALKLAHQLDEPEKVVIPQFVAEALEKAKGDNWYASQLINAMYDSSDEVGYWLEVPSNEKLLLRAWLDGYEEKEKLYVVVLSNGHLTNYLAYDLVDNVFFISRTQEEILNKFKKRFTEQEIKDYDERFWPFAVEVAE